MGKLNLVKIQNEIENKRENDRMEGIVDFLGRNFDDKNKYACKDCSFREDPRECFLYNEPHICKEAGLKVVRMPRDHPLDYRIKFLPRKEETLLEIQLRG